LKQQSSSRKNRKSLNEKETEREKERERERERERYDEAITAIRDYKKVFFK